MDAVPRAPRGMRADSAPRPPAPGAQEACRCPGQAPCPPTSSPHPRKHTPSEKLGLLFCDTAVKTSALSPYRSSVTHQPPSTER